MTESLEIQNSLNIPKEELNRQAVDSLRGYIYQIYQSINAWIGLNEEETLLLEVAEDYAVLAKDVLTGTQVKDTVASGSITLRSDGIISAIKSLFRYQRDNPDKSVRINYLTTSTIGKENKLSFPNNSKGLEYWRIASRDGNDVQPIREALLSLEFPEDIIEFIKEASPEELQNQLLRRIKWICGAEDIDDLTQSIDKKLVYLGEKQGIMPSEAEGVKDALINAVLQKIANKTNRSLNRADLLRIFEKSVAVSIPKPVLRKLINPICSNKDNVQITSTTDIVLNASQIPFPPQFVHRNNLVNRFISSIRLSGVLWLYGSSGVGKTILALFIAKQSSRNWQYLRLRNCSESGLDFRLRNVLTSLDTSDLGGLILDDYPLTYAHSTGISLSILAKEILSVDGLIIVIADKPPPSSVEAYFSKNVPCIEKVPYLNKEEVAELVKKSNGEPEKWASLIHTFCGMGHPQLVNARINGLKRRGWPDNELLNGVGNFGKPAEEVEYEREDIRKRLIDELPKKAREMLYRLTLFGGYFDRNLALELGSVNPSINSPGEMLDLLVGPWIEKIGIDIFQISPLVSDAGAKNLSKSIISDIHKQIVDHLLTRVPFPGEYLNQLLLHSILSRHEQGLLWLSIAVLMADDKNLKKMSEQLIFLPFMKVVENEPLFPENMSISVMLRLAQFKVSAAANITDELDILADQLIAEARLLEPIEPKEILKNLLYIAIITVLMERTLKIRSKKWMPLILELKEIAAIFDKNFGKLPSVSPFESTELKGVDIDQFIFVFRTTALVDIEDLSELFTILNDLTPEHRNYLLSSFQYNDFNLHLMVSNAWLAEHRNCKGEIDGVLAAKTYEKLTEIAVGWENMELAIECECSRSIMLDEYAHDKEGALNAIDEAEKKYPNNIHLASQRAKILFRSGEHQAVLAAIEPIINNFPNKDNIDYIYVLREAGISAAKTGNFTKAIQLFDKAYNSAVKFRSILLPMAAGLLADCAIFEFKAGNYSNALKYMLQALIEAEKIDPEKGINQKFCIIIIGATIMWMRSKLTDRNSGFDFQIVYGCCSNPNPHEEIVKKKTSPKLILWYQLAELEADIGVDQGIMKQLLEKTKLKKHIDSELMLNITLMAKYIREKDPILFFAYLPDYVGKCFYFNEHKDKLTQNNLNDFEPVEFVVPQPDDWMKSLYIEIVKNVVLAFSVSLLCSDNFDVKIFSSNINKIDGLNHAISDFWGCFEKQLSPNGNMYEQVAAGIGKLADSNSEIKPDELFLISCHFFNWLPNSYLKKNIEIMISEYLVKKWLYIIENQRFLLRQPMINVPIIRDAINSDLLGIKKIAKIALASEYAVSVRLTIGLRQTLKKTIKE